MWAAVDEFLEASAFERYALGSVFPLADVVSGPAASVEVRTGHVTAFVRGSTLSGGREQLAQQLRPLLFGAAWKVLDILVELGLGANSTGRWTISEKARRAREADVPPLSTHRELWERIAGVYSGTQQQRHCLVHRAFTVASDGTMTSMKHGTAVVADLTVDEQAAFCRLAQRVAFRSEVSTT